MFKKNPSNLEPGENAMTPAADNRLSESKEGRAERRAKLRADGALAKRCLAGEVAAWEELYAQCHDPLTVSVRIMLGPQNTDMSMVDEITARVWYALVAKDGELLARYKPRRGARLITFMRALAKDEIVRYIRTEVRRRNRELTALRESSRHPGKEGMQPVNVLGEFLGTLTPHEQVFCNDYLLAMPTGAVKEAYSKTNVWQLSHRIRRKLHRFLNQGQE